MNEDLYYLGIKGIIRNSKGEILLLKVNPSKFERTDKLIYWDIPGGRIQTGDNVEETLRREIYEETGVRDIKNIEPFLMVLSNIRIPKEGKSYGLILSTYTCDIDPNEKILLSDEHTDFGWFNLKEASKLFEIKYPKEFTQKIRELNFLTDKSN